MLPPIKIAKCAHANFMLFANNDVLSNVLFNTGRWEAHLIGIAGALCQGAPQPFVMDIGANLGAFCVPVAKALQTVGGSVYAYEPQRIVCYQLCGNAILNGLSNLHAFHQAIGDYDGQIDVPELNYQAAWNIGGFSLNKEYRELNGTQGAVLPSTSPVEIRKLDNLVVPKSPSLIKIDVEGFEINVFRGAANFLRTHQFPPVLFEAWGEEWFRREKQELLEFVTGLGYEIRLLEDTNYLAQHPLNPAHLEFVDLGEGRVKLVRTR